MFEHENFEVYNFNEIPLEEESILMDECWMKDYEQAMLDSFSSGEYKNVGYVGLLMYCYPFVK